MPSFSVTRRYCARTLSEKVTTGNLSRSIELLDGETLSPFPKSAGTMMKYLEGLRELFNSEMSFALSWIAAQRINLAILR